MELDINLIMMIIGFTLAAYSIVANDAIQTLGTFLSSNAHRPWWVLWAFTMFVLLFTLLYGYYANAGDISYGRLEKFPAVEPAQFSWIYLLPPVFILFVTRFGIPVSTTFLVLTVFTTANLEKMLTKSILGYLVAFVVGFILYRFVVAVLEMYFIKTSDEVTPSSKWVVAQWLSTGFLWSQWLIQDLANIYIYAPSAGINKDGVRTISIEWLIGSIVLFLILHAIIFANRGGEIQKIVTSKTNTADIRSATIVDFTYGIILLVFKNLSSIPMSTTWVFLGLLAGREFAIAYVSQLRKPKEVRRVVLSDMGKALIGLLVSLTLAFSAPYLKDIFVDKQSDSVIALKEIPNEIQYP
jgi:phosphate/sulfate permease